MPAEVPAWEGPDTDRAAAVRSGIGSGHTGGAGPPGEAQREAAPAAAYFLRNLSTRPAVSTIFCLPV